MRFGKLLFLFVAAGFLAGCPVTQRQDTPVSAQRLSDPASGANYWLYVPSNYEELSSCPLVVTLHGSKVWDGSKRQMKEWKYLAQKHGFIVAAPQVRSAEGILPVLSRETQLANDEAVVLSIIDRIGADYPAVDTDAVLLTGFSAGGYPMYYIGLRNPERFDMLIARACNSSMDTFENIELTDEVRNQPIAIFWGKNDLSLIRKHSWQAFRWLRENRCFKTTRKMVAGGHLRRPGTAYKLWSQSRHERGKPLPRHK